VNGYRPDPAPPANERNILWQEIMTQAAEIVSPVQDANENEIDALYRRSIRRYRRWTRVRFTLDSNILVRALASPRGPAWRVLDIIRHAHTLVLSRFILDEVERVLLYPRLRARYRIMASEAARFTGNLAAVAHMVEPMIVPTPPTIPSCTLLPTEGLTCYARGISDTSIRMRCRGFVRRAASAS